MAFAYFFPELHIQSSSNLSAFVSSFMAEYWAILEALTCISFLPCGDFLIVSNFQASILEIINNPFLSKCSPIILKICALLVSLKIRLFTIFLWAPRHIGINGNEHSDSLVGYTTNQPYSGGPMWCPYTDLVTIHRTSIQEIFKMKWDFLLEYYAFGYRSLFKNIPIQPWF